MMSEKFYCAFVRPDKRWVELCQFSTRQEAENLMQMMLRKDQQRYTPRNLRVLSRAELKQEFGSEWVRVYTAYA